ncbi:MAG: hypothetical protein SFY67_09945 [Candidatus Melainabacteria bacterium]|nr:hypothetical protein [Candidatus Melainabacteria bacterium]
MLASVYLTGDTINDKDGIALARDWKNELRMGSGASYAVDWRSFAFNRLESYGFKVVNPLSITYINPSADRDSREVGLGETNDMRVRRALDLIDQSDALLANLEESNVGVAMEIFYAHRRGKMVTVVGPSPFSPWVLSHSQARFNDIDKAIEYIAEEQPRTAPASWAIQYEAQLSERYEQLPPHGEPDYKFMGGEFPFLVLSPHATAYWHEGEFMEPDSFTGSLSSVINKSSDCHAMISNFCAVADPCWYLETPFRRAITDIVKTGKVGMVMIVLGSSSRETAGIQMTYHGSQSSVCSNYYHMLKNRLAAFEPVQETEMDLQARPLATFLSDELQTPTVVLRLSKRYRMPRLQPELFSKMADTLSAFARSVGEDLLWGQK